MIELTGSRVDHEVRKTLGILKSAEAETNTYQTTEGFKKAFTVQKLANQGAHNSPHCAHAIAELENIADGEHSHSEHTLKTASDKEALMIKWEINFLIDAFENSKF